MTDLTRFDFHALRFMKSLDVMAMSAEEVGTYVLLLCESWLIGDDCTLPDDIVLISRLARVPTISDKVLSKFPQVRTEKWGKRRRNPVLYAEWQSAENRSDSKRKAADVRWEGERKADAMQVHSTSNAPRNSLHMPKPNQSESNQTKPTGQSTFSNISIRYKRLMPGGTVGHDKRTKSQYADLCQRFGEDSVLSAFEEWADANAWKDSKPGLYFFFQDAPELIEENNTVHKMETDKQEPAENVEAAIAAGRELAPEVVKRMQEIEDEKKQIEELKEQPFAC